MLAPDPPDTSEGITHVVVKDIYEDGTWKKVAGRNKWLWFMVPLVIFNGSVAAYRRDWGEMLAWFVVLTTTFSLFCEMMAHAYTEQIAEINVAQARARDW